MSWIALCIIVLFGTAIWPLGRWALRGDGEPIVVGFWVSLTVAGACADGNKRQRTSGHTAEPITGDDNA